MVRREDPAVVVDGQQTGAERVQIFAAIVKGDQNVGAMSLAKQAVLNLSRGHGDKRLRVGLPG